MPAKQGKVEKCCAHYRQRISECRNCQYEDIYYKECFLSKKKPKGNGKLLIDNEYNIED